VACAFSGGPDSSALIALAVHHGLDVDAHHVDHRLRPESAAEADAAERIAGALGVSFVRHTVGVPPGPNLEARARTARLGALPSRVLTGHTADDQAETVLLRLLRGSGGDGLSGIAPGPTHPILALRRTETEAVCAELRIDPVRDASNHSPAMWRNRVRHELLPLACDIAGRDLTPILARTAGLLRDDGAVLADLAAGFDATDAVAIAAAPPAIARRAIRKWLTVDGYPPDAASVERVIAVARGTAVACELSDGRRVARSKQRLRIVTRGQ
jgi:tRNA(Ile)-lysidine synthase